VLVSEPRRRGILQLVWMRELSASEIASTFDIGSAAVSHHLRVLREAGLLRQRRQGRYRYYRADRDRLGPLAVMLEAMWAQSLDRLVKVTEEESGKRG
jgi:DNA-binding transcriptional ArsR family regulator